MVNLATIINKQVPAEEVVETVATIATCRLQLTNASHKPCRYKAAAVVASEVAMALEEVAIWES